MSVHRWRFSATGIGTPSADLACSGGGLLLGRGLDMVERLLVLIWSLDWSLFSLMATSDAIKETWSIPAVSDCTAQGMKAKGTGA